MTLRVRLGARPIGIGIRDSLTSGRRLSSLGSVPHLAGGHSEGARGESIRRSRQVVAFLGSKALLNNMWNKQSKTASVPTLTLVALWRLFRGYRRRRHARPLRTHLYVPRPPNQLLRRGSARHPAFQPRPDPQETTGCMLRFPSQTTRMIASVGNPSVSCGTLGWDRRQASLGPEAESRICTFRRSAHHLFAARQLDHEGGNRERLPSVLPGRQTR
jgi:hypothetical protein